MVRILRWLGIALAGLAGAAVLLLAVVWVINLRDESLTPVAQALLRAPANPYKAEDNLYIALAGSDAPSGRSVISAGQAKVDYYNQRLDSALRDPSRADSNSLTLKDPQHLEFKGDCSFVQQQDSSVWSDAPQHREEIGKLLSDNGELYQRYLALHALRGYYETARPSYLTPYFAWPTEARKLFLADLVLRMQSTLPAGQSREALVDLESDVRMWRVVLHGEGTLLSKMRATAYLQADYLLVADMIADPDLTMPLSDADAEALVPAPDLKDWDIGSALAAEFRVTSSVLRQTADPSFTNRITGHFFQRDATENLLAARTARQVGAAADPVSFYRTRNKDPDTGDLQFSYNVVGRVLASVASGTTDNYVLRAWDGAALQRLVRLGYEIRRQHIEAVNIPAFLQQHPEMATHPADQRPFIWDPQRAEIRVSTVAKQPPSRRFSIRIWQPALAASGAPR